MRAAKLWRALAIVAVLLAALVVSAILVVHTSWASARVLRWATALLDARYRLALSARNLSYNAITLRVTLDDVRLAARGHEDRPFFTARRVEVRLPRSVYSGLFAIDSLSIDGGASDIVRDEAGVSNLPPSSGGPVPLVPRRANIRAIAFENFNFRYLDRLRDLALSVPGITANLKHESNGATGPFWIHGQTTFRRHEQTIALQPAEARLTFDGSNISFEGLSLSSADLGATFRGEVRRVLDAPALDLSIDGVAHLGDAVRWVTSPVPVSGSANVRGTLTGPPSEIEITLNVSGNDLSVGKEAGVRIDGPVRITPDAASSDGMTITPATGGSIRASFDVPFTSAPAHTRAEYTGLDLRSAFRLSNVDPPPLGSAIDGELTFETGETRKLVFTNRGTARSSPNIIGISGTAKGSLIGNAYQVEQAHSLPGLSVEGKLSGVLNTTRAIHSTIAGTPDVHLSDIATAAASLATIGVPIPAFAHRIGGALDAPAVSLSGTFDEPVVHAGVSGEALDIPSLGVVSAKAILDADSHKASFADVEAHQGSATVTGDLAADLDARTWSGALRIEAADAADVQSALPEAWRLSGPVRGEATVGGALDAIHFQTTLNGANLTLSGQPVDQLTATAFVTTSAVDVTSLEMKGYGGRVAGRVKYDWDTDAYEANLDGTDLTYRGSLLAKDDTLAKVSMHFQGAGTTADLGGKGTAAFSISGGTAGTLIGDGELDFDLQHDRVSYQALLPSLNAHVAGTVGAFAPYEYRAEAELNGVPLAPLAAIADAREGAVKGFLRMTAKIAGAIDSEDGQTATVDLQDIDATIGETPIKLAAPTALSWERHSLTVGQFELGVGKGKFSAAGTWTNRTDQQFEGSYTGTVEDVGGIAHAFKLPSNLDGTGNLTTTFKWTGDPNRASGTLTLRDGSIASFQGPAPVTGLEIDAKLDGKVLTVSRVAGRLATEAIEGDFSAHATANVPELTLDAIDGEFVLDQASLTMSFVPVTQQRPSRVTFAKGVFTAADVAWTVADSPLVISGTTTIKAGEETTLDLAIKGQSDLRILSAFFPTLGFDGTGEIDARVTGTPSALRVNGTINLDDAELALPDPRLVISDLSGPVTLSGDTIVVEHLSGSANGGSIALDGRLQLSGLELSGGSMIIQAQGVAIEYPRGLRAEIDALLTFRPEARAPTLTGDVRVLQGSYTEAITLAGLAARGGTVAPSLNLQEQPRYVDSIRLNVSVTTEEDLVMDNNYGRLEAGASVRLVGTVAEPGMDGRITLREGGQLFLAGRTFRITRGDISFTDLRRIEPEFDIAAETHVAPHDVTMTLTGTIDKPSLELSTPEGGESTGDLATEIVGGGVTAENALTLLSADLLGVTGRAIGLDTFRVERGEQLDTDFREDPSLIADETNPAARLTIAKRLSDEVEVTVSQNLRESGKTTFVISYFPVTNFEVRSISRDNSTLVFGIRHRVTIGGGPSITERPKPPLISSVTFPSDDPIVQATISRKLIRLKAGERFDFIELQKDVDRLREALHAQGYYEARVRTRRIESEDRESVTIEYRIDRGPHTTVEVRGVELSANERKDLEDAWVKGIVFDRFLIDDLVLHVQRDLVTRGELNSIVLGSVIRGANGDKRVRIDVTPGIPVSGRKLRFDGNQHVAAQQLLEAIKAARIDLEPWFDPKVLDRPIRTLYSQQGFLKTQVTAGPLEIDGTEAVLPVKIVEGPQAQITSFAWTGVTAEHEYILNQSHGLQPPQAFLTSEVNDARRRVERAYRAQGFNNAEVAITPHIVSDEAVELTFDVVEGPQQILQEVAIAGNTRTFDKVITEALRFGIGKPVNLDEWALARKRLYDTNVFRQVAIETAPSGATVNGEQPVRANVSVQEYPPWTVRYGAQLEGDREVDLQKFVRTENLGLVTEIKNPNLLGRALTFGVSGQFLWDQRDATMFLATSRLFGWRARSSLFGELSRIRLRDDQRNILALSHISRVTAEQRWKRRTVQVVYGYRLERNRTFDPDPSALDPFPLDSVSYLAKLTNAALWDRRNDPLNTTTGTFSSASWDISSPLLGSDLSNSKLLLQQFYFRPFNKRFVFASRAQVGLAFGRDDLLPNDAFRAGGATTVRGYAEGSLGPRGLLGLPSGGEALFVLNGEVRLPLYRWIRGVGFVDAGNIFAHDEPVRIRDLKLGYGFGLRLDTPVGLFRVDFGIPASALNGVASSREPNSLRGGRWYFGLGHIF